MLIPTIIMGVLAIAVTVFAYYRSGAVPVTGLKNAGILLLQMTPMLVFAMILASMVPLLLPQGVISTWIGPESGMRGIAIGTVVGSVLPGGPYVSLPMIAGFLKMGVGVGTAVAMVTAWLILGLSRLPMEIGFMGWRFTLVRLACSFFFPPLAGLLASWWFRTFTP